MEFTSHVISIEKSEFCDVFLTPKRIQSARGFHFLPAFRILGSTSRVLKVYYVPIVLEYHFGCPIGPMAEVVDR